MTTTLRVDPGRSASPLTARALEPPEKAHAMRILMVAARYFPFVGGVETHVHEVGTRMAALGHHVSLLTTDPTGTLPATEYVEGMKIMRVKSWPKDRDYYFAPGIFKKIGQIKSDIIHFQGYNTFVAPIGMAAAIHHAIPFTLTFHSGGHSSYLRNAIRGLQLALIAPLARRASRLIGVSEFEASAFAKGLGVPRELFALVPNGASMPSPSGGPWQHRGHLVVSIGRLERYKGHHRVVAAFPEVLNQLPDARLRIVGSGPYEAELRRLVTAVGLDERVTIESIPPEQRQRLSDLLSAAGVVVLLSEYEAHPVAIIEALALRCPVLVGDNSGLRELAQAGLCRSVSLRATSTEIAHAIVAELKSKAEPPPVTLPSWDDCARELLGIYAGVLNGVGGRSSVDRLAPRGIAQSPLGQQGRGA